MEDLDMTVTQYNTCVSILFVGYSQCLSEFGFDKNVLTSPSPHASALEFGREQDQMAGSLYMCCCCTLGSCFRVHSSSQFFRQPCGMPVYAWLC